mmetsp:Transcript_9883/g.20088  ORF Transcript_9883/g.20088 Transcript_9883/m.20088 type:complete len:210 (-) Transcript_9883:1708-2337(-)
MNLFIGCTVWWLVSKDEEGWGGGRRAERQSVSQLHHLLCVCHLDRGVHRRRLDGDLQSHLGVWDAWFHRPLRNIGIARAGDGHESKGAGAERHRRGKPLASHDLHPQQRLAAGLLPAHPRRSPSTSSSPGSISGFGARCRRGSRRRSGGDSCRAALRRTLRIEVQGSGGDRGDRGAGLPRWFRVRDLAAGRRGQVRVLAPTHGAGDDAR